MQESTPHFSEMKKIQRTILTTELQPLLQKKPEVWHPLERKLSKISVRSTFAVWAYECYLNSGIPPLEHKANLFKIIIPLAAEHVITHAYLFNQIYDQKYDVISQAAIDRNLLYAHQLESHFLDFILYHPQLNSEEKKKIADATNGMMMRIEKGQKLTKKTSGALLRNLAIPAQIASPRFIDSLFSQDFVKGYLEPLTSTKDIFTQRALRAYFSRCFLISADLFVTINQLIADLLEVDKRHPMRKAMHNFAEQYGCLLQIVNDNADFVYEKPTNYKISNDVLSDIKNSTYTLPLIFHFEEKGIKSGLIQDMFFAPQASWEYGNHNRVLKSIMSSGAIRKSMLIGMGLAKFAKSKLPKHPASIQKLNTMLSIAHNNRYYRHIYNAKKFYKKNPHPKSLYICEHHSSHSKN